MINNNSTRILVENARIVLVVLVCVSCDKCYHEIVMAPCLDTSET